MPGPHVLYRTMKTVLRSSPKKERKRSETIGVRKKPNTVVLKLKTETEVHRWKGDTDSEAYQKRRKDTGLNGKFTRNIPLFPGIDEVILE